MTCTYRGHGACSRWARRSTGRSARSWARHGLCGGKGGSMHLTDVTVGALGSFAIVGAHLPIACGTGFAAQLLGTGSVSLASSATARRTSAPSTRR